MSLIERIKQVIDYKDISVSAFEQKIGASDGMIRRAIKNNTDIQSKWLTVMSDNFHDIDIEWLVTGKGEMLREDKKYTPTTFKLKTDYNVENQFIPLYEIDAAAGLITLFDNQVTQNPVGEISIPNAPKCDGALYVRGDSMYPILKSGDIVAYKTIYDPNNIFWGEMYLIDIDVEGEQYLTIKYIQRSDKGDDYVYLVSHNGNHQPVHILKSNIRALALVKASIRYNSMG